MKMNKQLVSLVVFLVTSFFFDARCAGIKLKQSANILNLKILSLTNSKMIDFYPFQKFSHKEGEPIILMVKLGNKNIVPSSEDRTQLEKLLKSLPEGNKMYLLGYRKDTGEYAFFTSMRVAQVFPQNAYDILKSKLTDLFPHSTYNIIDYSKNLNTISKF